MDALKEFPLMEVQPESWLGELCFDVEPRPEAGGTRSRLTYLSHFGPMRIQRPFYPEADGTAHVYVLHPPGGVAGGDHLRVIANVHGNANALVTVPAATKIYHSLGGVSVIENRLTVESGGCLEWLPQETILFDGALADVRSLVELEGDANYLGWETVCLGRPAAGEEMRSGHLSQSLEVYRDGRPLVVDRLVVPAQSDVCTAAWGLDGANVIGTFVIAWTREDLTEPARAALQRAKRQFALECDRAVGSERAQRPAAGRLAVTQLEGAFVARYLGFSVAECHDAFCELWSELRPRVLCKQASVPRIWRV